MTLVPPLTREQKTNEVRTRLACFDFGPTDSYLRWPTPSTLRQQLATRRRRSDPDFIEKARARVRKELGLE